MTQQEKDLKRSHKIVGQNSARCFLRLATYNRLNSRRHGLIKKMNRDGLTTAEWLEFTILEEEVVRLVHLAYPIQPRMIAIAQEQMIKLANILKKVKVKQCL